MGATSTVFGFLYCYGSLACLLFVREAAASKAVNVDKPCKDLLHSVHRFGAPPTLLLSPRCYLVKVE